MSITSGSLHHSRDAGLRIRSAETWDTSRGACARDGGVDARVIGDTGRRSFPLSVRNRDQQIGCRQGNRQRDYPDRGATNRADVAARCTFLMTPFLGASAEHCSND